MVPFLEGWRLPEDIAYKYLGPYLPCLLMIPSIVKIVKKYRSVVLLIVSLGLFVGHGVLEEKIARSYMIDAVTTLFIGTIFLVAHHRSGSSSTFLLVVTSFALSTIWLDNFFPTMARPIRQFEDLAFILLISFFVLNRVSILFNEKRVDLEHLSATFALYIVVGLWWGYLFDLIQETTLSAFTYPSGLRSSLGNFFYLSLANLSAISTNEILPHSSLTRCLTALEAICGQFYIAILVGHLVGISLQSRMK